MENSRKKGLFDNVAPVVVLFSIATMVVGISLLRDDVLSTAETMFRYFPEQFGVYPATDFTGAVVLGLFISVTQIVSLVVATSPNFPKNIRWIAGFIYGTAAAIDGYTDVVHRSGGLKGDVPVSIGVTLGFYTFGSEFSTSLAAAVFGHFWRKATSDIMFGAAQFFAFLGNMAKEFSSYQRAARNRETKYLNDRAKEVGDFGFANNSSNRNNQNQNPNRPNETGRIPPDRVPPEDFISMSRTADGRPIYNTQQNGNQGTNHGHNQPTPNQSILCFHFILFYFPF